MKLAEESHAQSRDALRQQYAAFIAELDGAIQAACEAGDFEATVLLPTRLDPKSLQACLGRYGYSTKLGDLPGRVVISW